MTTRKRNEFLDIAVSDDEDNDRGYDSEAAEESKGRNVKRRRTQTRSGGLESGSEVEESDVSDSEGGNLEVEVLARPKTKQLRSEDDEDALDDVLDEKDEENSGAIGDEDHYLDVTGETEKAKAKKQGPLDRLKAKPTKRKKTGVVYLSSLPPYLKPFALKSLLETRGFGPITKVFLTPEVRSSSAPRRKSNKRKMYTDGWVEFESKKTAKICAETLNATTVGGRKGGWYYDDIWSMKYLTGFRWDDLIATVSRERSEATAKRRIEDTRARKEEKVFLQGYEKGKMLDGIQKKNEEKRKRRLEISGEKSEKLEREQTVKPRRLFKQNEVKQGRDKMAADAEGALLRLPRCYHGAVRIISTSTHVTISRQPLLMADRIRTLTSTSRRASEPSLSSQLTPGTLSAKISENTEQKFTSESSQHVPWYLQEETSVPEVAEVTATDHLPELPENSPKILPVVLEYIYKDLGLDELKLYDLRTLETPPALGANVIMVMGTVRSVKHLNVSADRLCRWLRSNYKLSPYADGLLGRNELKIKLRRKNRRARLASRTGGVVDDKDDGITTGWICVNAGVVEKAAVQEVSNDAFEGFGNLGGGTRLVVQLFTEEKRAELNLEGLWDGRIRAAEREKMQRTNVSADAPEEVRFPNSISSPSSDSISPAVPRLQFHTKRPYITHGVFPVRHFMSWTKSIVRKKTPAPDITWGILRDYLENLPDEQFELSMNRNLDKDGHNDLLSLTEQSLGGFHARSKMVARMELEAMGLQREHPQYSKKNLFDLFEGYLVWSLPIDDDIVAFVLKHLLAPRGRKNQDPNVQWLPDSDRELALEVLEKVSISGRNLMNMEMWFIIYQSASLPSTPEGDGSTPAERSAHVLRMIEGLEIPFDPLHARLLMGQIFRNGDHESFWTWWRKLPLNDSPRTGNDYAQLFAMHADLATEVQIRDCLNTWIPLMRSEEPRIDVEGQLARKILGCLEKVQPDIKKQANSGATTTFADLWRECEQSLKQSQ
ncbi:hypothetical protein BJX64DRAFT_273770 [Aspergillus heterothallicus]